MLREEVALEDIFWLLCFLVAFKDESLYSLYGDSKANPLPSVRSVRLRASRVRSAISLQKLQWGSVQSSCPPAQVEQMCWLPSARSLGLQTKQFLSNTLAVCETKP